MDAIASSGYANESDVIDGDTYEEPNSGGDLAKKALSQTGMGNYYERIRLAKPKENEMMLSRLKEQV